MNYAEFTDRLRETIPVGTVLINPGGGTSEVLSYPNDKVAYSRGTSTIYVSTRGLFDAYNHFKGQHVSASDLKSYSSAIYDSAANGHSCNCTFLFLSMQRMGIVDTIQGRGVRGDPFSVEVKNA